MRITKIYCDHCGKTLCENSNYTDLNIRMNHKTHNVDLCTECFEKLDEKIRGFCKRSDTE